MSYLLDGIDDHLLRNETPLGDEPLTLHLFFKSTSASLAQMLIDLGAAGTLNNSWAMLIAGNLAGDPVQVQTRDTAGSFAATTAPYAANAWQSATGVYVSDTDRRAFINGGGKGTNAVARAVAAAITQIRLGLGTTGLSPFVGRLAEVSIFNVALSDADVALLAAGRSPMALATPPIRYWRLKDTLLDINGVNALTAVNGATLDAADNPVVDDPPGGGGAAHGSLAQTGGGATVISGHKTAHGGSITTVSGSTSLTGTKHGSGALSVAGGGETTLAGRIGGRRITVSGGGDASIVGRKVAHGTLSVAGGGGATVRLRRATASGRYFDGAAERAPTTDYEGTVIQ